MYILPVLSFFGLAALTIATPVPESLDTRESQSTANTPACPDYCAGTQINKTLIHDYVCGDTRLGPKRLPHVFPSTTSSTATTVSAASVLLTTTGGPIEGTISLSIGTMIDRFGSEYGKFVSPAGAPYMQRALPPSNLDTPAGDPTFPYNYHVYKVLVSFNVLAGPIAPWFGQPGQGTQYLLDTNIIGLINGGFLARVDLKTL